MRRTEEICYPNELRNSKSQIDNLAQESLECSNILKEFGIEATNPPQFIDKAKDIVCKHNELQKKEN